MLWKGGGGGWGGGERGPWGVELTQFCWALCRPQPCRPIKVADAVQGPLTAADMPLAKRGESLAAREALSAALQLGPASAWSARLSRWHMSAEEVQRGLQEGRSGGRGGRMDNREGGEKTDSQSVFESDLVNNSEAAWVLWSLSGLRAEGYLWWSSTCLK